MINIVGFWEQQIAAWNTSNKCGMCWEFHAPLKESQSNIQQLTDPCCAIVLLTDYKITKPEGRVSGNTGFVNQEFRNHQFVLHVVKQDALGKNNHTEIPNHPVNESRWETIYKPLSDCIDTGKALEFCLYLGLNPNNISFTQDISHAYLDQNFYGWRFLINFKIEI